MFTIKFIRHRLHSPSTKRKLKMNLQTLTSEQVDRMKAELKKMRDGRKFPEYNKTASQAFKLLALVNGKRAQILTPVSSWDSLAFTSHLFLSSAKFANYETGDVVECEIVGYPLRRKAVKVGYYGHPLNSSELSLLCAAWRSISDNENNTDNFLALLETAYDRTAMTEEEISDDLDQIADEMIAEEQPEQPKTERPFFHMTEEHRNVFNMLHTVSQKRPTKVLMVGPSGYGKTATAENYAYEKGLNYLRVNVGEIDDPVQFFGYHKAEKGSTFFVPSPFTKAVKAGNAVIVLDEINRIESTLTNILFPLLDYAAETQVLGQTIKVGKGVTFVMTANIGYQFSGTFELDTAFVNRVDMRLHVQRLEQETEKEVLAMRFPGNTKRTINKIVAVSHWLRNLAEETDANVDVSTRVSLRIAEFAEFRTMSLLDIFRNCVVSNVELEQRKSFEDLVSGKLLTWTYKASEESELESLFTESESTLEKGM